MPAISPYLQDQGCWFVSVTQAWLAGRGGGDHRAEWYGTSWGNQPTLAGAKGQKLLGCSQQGSQEAEGWAREVPASAAGSLLAL